MIYLDNNYDYLKGGDMDNKILEKTKKVIDSCRTREQLKVANKFAELTQNIDDDTFEQCKSSLISKDKELTIVMDD